MSTRPIKHFHFLLLPEYPALSLSSAQETLQSFNTQLGERFYSWSMGTASGEPAVASLGESYPRGEVTGTPPNTDALVVVGGLNIERYLDCKVLGLLRWGARQNLTVLGLSTGAFALAKAGLLNGRQATIHWKYRESFVELFPEVLLSNTAYILDGKIGTTAGGVSAIDLMLRLIAEDHGEDDAASVAESMSYSPIRDLHSKLDFSLPHRIGMRHPTLAMALRLMEANIEDPLRASELASAVSVSTRQLERLFRDYLGCTPMRYYTRLRLSRGRNLLIQTDMSVSEIAVATGFGSMTSFSKLYRQQYQVQPSLVRLGKQAP